MHILRTVGKFLGNLKKKTSFRGNSWRLLVAKTLPASENHFHPETIGFQNVYFLLQLQLNLQNERDRSLLKTTPQAGCHEIA